MSHAQFVLRYQIKHEQKCVCHNNCGLKILVVTMYTFCVLEREYSRRFRISRLLKKQRRPPIKSNVRFEWKWFRTTTSCKTREKSKFLSVRIFVMAKIHARNNAEPKVNTVTVVLCSAP